jgi:hypothetical protein
MGAGRKEIRRWERRRLVLFLLGVVSGRRLGVEKRWEEDGSWRKRVRGGMRGWEEGGVRKESSIRSTEMESAGVTIDVERGGVEKASTELLRREEKESRVALVIAWRLANGFGGAVAIEEYVGEAIVVMLSSLSLVMGSRRWVGKLGRFSSMLSVMPAVVGLIVKYRR